MSVAVRFLKSQVKDNFGLVFEIMNSNSDQSLLTPYSPQVVDFGLYVREKVQTFVNNFLFKIQYV